MAISIENCNFFTPHVFNTPAKGFPLEFYNGSVAQKLEWCPYQGQKSWIC